MNRTAVFIVGGYAFALIGLGAGYVPDLASAQVAVTARQASSPLAGFDTCTAPPLHTMKVWRAKFSAVGIYIGGEDMACSYGNLSAGWVRAVKAMGWSLLPIYVGPQPSCDRYAGRINPKVAAAQGRIAGAFAVKHAKAFGIGKGSPIYYDIESYNRKNSRCASAVLTFLDAWDRKLRAEGYISGVYSSADAAIVSLESTKRINGHPLAKPKAVWIAFWNNKENLTAAPYLKGSAWARTDLSKQYSGPHKVKVGGIALNVDADLINSPAVHARRAKAPPHPRGR
jgi:hypothetical protein